jgi:beta-glucanase (GH16 family)
MRSLLLFAVFALAPLTRAQTVPANQWIAFNRAGAPNSNLQCFTPQNVGVSDGFLMITTKAEVASCSSFDLPRATYHYTSGFVSMRRFNFLYGVLEFRAKFGGGSGSGAWPVVWLADASCQATDPTGTEDECNSQEIDVAEILQSNFARVNQQIHVDNFAHNDGCTASTTDTSRTFHVYQLAWSPGTLIFRIDGVTTCKITKPYVPSAPMYVKMNVFAGKFGGPVNDATFPWVTMIDYVRVKQGSTVVFADDFNLDSTIQPGPVPSRTPSPARHLPQSAGSQPWLHRSFGVILVCLMAVALATVLLRTRK